MRSPFHSDYDKQKFALIHDPLSIHVVLDHVKVPFGLGTHFTHSIHTNVPPPRMAGRAVHNGAAVAVEKGFPSGDAVQLAGVGGCGRNRR